MRETFTVVTTQGWTHGPLPEQALEDIALKLFVREYPERFWFDSLFEAQRNDCRRFVREMREDVVKAAWAVGEREDGKAIDALTEGSLLVLAGARELSDETREAVGKHAAEYIAELWFNFRRLVQRDLDWKVS